MQQPGLANQIPMAATPAPVRKHTGYIALSTKTELSSHAIYTI